MIFGMTIQMAIGQFLGIVAVLLGFLSFQMRTQKQLLFMQLATTIVFTLHYWLIGATSGMVMNLLGIVRNFVYCHRDKKPFSSILCPIFFGIAMAVVGILSWQGYYSIFVLLGLVINTLCLAAKDPQFTRKSILVSSPLVLIYDIFVLSVGGIIYESVVIVSSIIGILRYKNQPAERTA